MYILSADGKTAAPVATGIGYNAFSQFFTLNVVTMPTFVLRATGINVNLGANTTFSNLANGRLLKLVAWGGVGRTSIAAPALSLFVNW